MPEQISLKPFRHPAAQRRRQPEGRIVRAIEDFTGDRIETDRRRMALIDRGKRHGDDGRGTVLAEHMARRQQFMSRAALALRDRGTRTIGRTIADDAPQNSHGTPQRPSFARRAVSRPALLAIDRHVSPPRPGARSLPGHTPADPGHPEFS